MCITIYERAGTKAIRPDKGLEVDALGIYLSSGAFLIPLFGEYGMHGGAGGIGAARSSKK